MRSRLVLCWVLAAAGGAIVACATKPQPAGPGSVFGVEEGPVAAQEPAEPAGMPPAERPGGEPAPRPRPATAEAAPPTSEGPLLAERASVRVEPVMTYVPWEESETGPVRLRVERDPPTEAGAPEGARAAWRVRRILTARDGAEQLDADYGYILTDEGAVAISEMIDHAERIEVVFDPPLLVLPAELEVGESQTQRTRMTVHPMGDRSKTRNAGEVVNEITYEGNERVRTPALPRGRPAWPARHVRSVFMASIGGPQIRNETETWFVDGLGVVSEQRHERTTIFGAAVRNNLERWALERVGPTSEAESPRPGPTRRLPGDAEPAEDGAPRASQ